MHMETTIYVCVARQGLRFTGKCLNLVPVFTRLSGCIEDVTTAWINPKWLPDSLLQLICNCLECLTINRYENDILVGLTNISSLFRVWDTMKIKQNMSKCLTSWVSNRSRSLLGPCLTNVWQLNVTVGGLYCIWPTINHEHIQEMSCQWWNVWCPFTALGYFHLNIYLSKIHCVLRHAILYYFIE